ncbi:MAG: hypothetical protein Q9M25_02440 [Mariprofundaceae bacterium]|nr:hypothetical protein [Mariprofundaceae bacterium]
MIKASIFRGLLAATLVCCVPIPGIAAKLSSIGEFSGSYRNLFLAGDTPAGDFVQTDSNRLRLQWRKNTGAWSAYVAYDNEFLVGGLLATPAFQAATRTPDPTWLDADAAIVQHSHVFWRHRLYRGWLAWEQDALLLKIGRQRIAWGSGRLWNPTDRFNPVDPTALELDQKTGADSILGEWRYSDSGALQIVTAPGRGQHKLSRKTAFRMRDTFGEMDVSMLAGRIGSETVFGADLAANVSGGGLHGELLHARPANSASYSQLSAGYEYTLSNRLLPEGLYLLGEYFFNGAAKRLALPGAAERLNSRVRHLFGMAAGYDITPLIRIEISSIIDVVKGSAFIAPRVTWSLAENWQLSAFVLAFGGHAGSEFGDRANVYTAQLDVYF